MRRILAGLALLGVLPACRTSTSTWLDLEQVDHPYDAPCSSLLQAHREHGWGASLKEDPSQAVRSTFDHVMSVEDTWVIRGSVTRTSSVTYTPVAKRRIDEYRLVLRCGQYERVLPPRHCRHRNGTRIYVDASVLASGGSRGTTEQPCELVADIRYGTQTDQVREQVLVRDELTRWAHYVHAR